ncbi:MAG: LysR family transcriptional regulator [Tissierellia bacterium]|nr:LysR family transcriptional regulator [Tissierellia bacterium]
MTSAIIFLENRLISKEEIEDLKQFILNLTGRGFRSIYLLVDQEGNLSQQDLKKVNVQIVFYDKKIVDEEYYLQFLDSLPDDRILYIDYNSYPVNLHLKTSFLNWEGEYVFACQEEKIFNTFLAKKNYLINHRLFLQKLANNDFNGLNIKAKHKIDFDLSKNPSFYDSIRCHNKITLSKNQKFFGPGLKVLLEYIDQTGSVKSAARRMGLSYSKAWKMINRMEEELGFEVLERTPGGVSGGESNLTKSGKDFLRKYEILMTRCDEYMLKVYKEIYKS